MTQGAIGSNKSSGYYCNLKIPYLQLPAVWEGGGRASVKVLLEVLWAEYQPNGFSFQQQEETHEHQHT